MDFRLTDELLAIRETARRWVRRECPREVARALDEAGRFPAELAARVIDGRDPVPGHGGPEMPIWGDAFLESRFGYSREQVKERIRLLVRHLETLQRE